MLGNTSAVVRPRNRRVLRLIALERIIRSALLLGRTLLFHLNSDFGRLGERV